MRQEATMSSAPADLRKLSQFFMSQAFKDAAEAVGTDIVQLHDWFN